MGLDGQYGWTSRRATSPGKWETELMEMMASPILKSLEMSHHLGYARGS